MSSHDPDSPNPMDRSPRRPNGPNVGASAPDLVLETSPRRVRVYFAGEAVADSTAVRLLHETGHTPVYYFPVDDVRMDLLPAGSHSSHSPRRGAARHWSVAAGGRVAENAAWTYAEPSAGGVDLSGLVAFAWDRMDHWFEEDEEVFVHARNPYKRVDALESTRHVQVLIDDVRVADSRRPVLLFETGLPTRYYLPKTDLRLDLLRGSSNLTACPYKGTASYWTIELNGATHADIAWEYHTPLPGVAKIADRVCFYNERVNLILDGRPQERPQTTWSDS